MNSGPARVSILRQDPYLIASIHTALDDSELLRFRQDLITSITEHSSRGVIIDVAALDVLDSFATQTLVDIGNMARLRGAATVVVGIRPEVAFAIVLLGMRTGSLATALDLEDALAYLGRLSSTTQTSSPNPAMKGRINRDSLVNR